ncbi:fb380bb6-10ce-46af-b6f6-a1287c6ff697 [Sclerotinia trifoliorum]|uniref:Fb380bb6-10ce-46af-b6f6-a1287c6ff697 n=1 Tax=Sclerotinia trifoliorum TaxID=28548 RepID=A0A8H2VRX3_9HELO|nr:fb380bb6-10ce-46af-b6f6-a1287c6ff697 [Sclerotinia trifoliorum]
MKIEEMSDDTPTSTPAPIAGEDFDLLAQAMSSAFPGFAPSNPSDPSSTTPSLPPSLASLRDKSGPEILKSLNSTPLFMTELEENNELEAFKALAYEGTPLEVATNFKEQGNDSFKEKRLVDAKEFYTKGVNILLAEVRRRQRGEKRDGDVPEEREDEVVEEIKVLEVLLVNRAMAHLGLKNYRSCILDCGAVLRINNKNTKALYRKIVGDDKALLALAGEILKKNEEIEAKRKKEVERLVREKNEESILKTSLAAREITLRMTDKPPEMEDAKIELVPDALDPINSTLSFPVLLLYPLAAESDFIKSFNEMDTVGQHLEYILPLPWDVKGEYRDGKVVECYVEKKKGSLIKVGRKVTLLKVLSGGEVVDGVVSIYVVPKQKAAGWIEEWKRKNVTAK